MSDFVKKIGDILHIVLPNSQHSISFDSNALLGAFDQAKELSHFIGLSLSSFKRFFLGKAQYQRTDLMTFIQTTGPEALIIVTIVNLLLGVILAFMGAAQLKLFGAEAIHAR